MKLKIDYILIAIILVGGMFLAAKLSDHHKTIAPNQGTLIQPPIPSIPTPTLEDAISSITTEECKENVSILAKPEWQGRKTGENDAACQWIKQQYESYGLTTEYQDVQYRRAKNIYAWIEGTTHKDEIVVVGAHMDGVGGRCLAADDNASGTAALLEIAEAFSKLPPPKRTIVFQSYNAEEQGLIGSQYYCNNPTFPKSNPSISKHVFMLNMDMISYLNNRGKFNVSFFKREGPTNIELYIDELENTYLFANKVTNYGGGGSDQQSFQNKGVPVVWLHTGIHAAYHTASDTPDRIEKQGSYQGIRDIARYAFELTWKVANDENGTYSNAVLYGSPMIVPNYDHGDKNTPFQNK